MVKPRNRKWLGVLLAAALAVSVGLPGLYNPVVSADEGQGATTTDIAEPVTDQTESGAEQSGSDAGQAKSETEYGSNRNADANEMLPLYSTVLQQWLDSGATTEHNGQFTIWGKDFLPESNVNATVGSYRGKDNVLIWTPERYETIHYQIDVKEAGLYVIDVSYHPSMEVARKNDDVSWEIMIDGVTPYRESRYVPLYRMWQDPHEHRKNPVTGDEIRPKAEDISTWMQATLHDQNGNYSEPLMWYLTPGTHTFSIFTKQPVVIESITFRAPDKIEDYETVRATWPEKQSMSEIEPIVIEAEFHAWKNQSSIPLAYNNDILSTPYVLGKRVFNVVDGERWSSNADEITWEFEVPESGYYKIALRAQQNFVSNKSSFRTILINGKVPFSEMKEYRFDYGTGWRGLVIQDENGNPYEFYLEKGKNTLTLRVTKAPVKPIIDELQAITLDIQNFIYEINKFTGGVNDSNRVYRLREEWPAAIPFVEGLRDRLIAVRDQIEVINGRKDAVSQGLETSIQDLITLLKNENNIPKEVGTFSTISGNLGTYISQLESQPLQLDRLVVVPVDQKVPRLTATFWEQLKGGFINFFYSFRSGSGISSEDPDVLNVWMLYGRDYVDLLQQMVDEDFTPRTGIKAKVNLLPGSELLLLMNAAGNAPDVAIGMSEGLPFDYALRGGLLDLSQFDDFDEVYEQFAPGSWTPFFYNNGYYGVPETQSFQVLFYRSDILQRLELNVPDTWEDVYDMLPKLQQNNMNFSTVPHIPFFYQNGAEYIHPTGLKTALNTQEAFKAFKEWTDVYNTYAVDAQIASFYQHFRNGTIPVGISDFNTYVQLTVAAPELNGRWGIAPIPGKKQEDGTVVRWLGGGLKSTVVFKQTDKPNESWEFIKWWLSADVQAEFGNTLEILNGKTFRWNTSNVEAFVQLPYDEQDLDAILEQWRWYKEIPQVPGNYYLERELNNAWNRTVVDGMNYRASLEQSIMEIEREMTRKLQEFGYIDSKGQVVRNLPVHKVTEPWDRVNQYMSGPWKGVDLYGDATDSE